MLHLSAQSGLLKSLSILVPIAVAGSALISVVGIQLYGPGGLKVSPVQSTQFQVSSATAAQDPEATRLKLLKILPTLGYSNLLADWTFLSFLQYFGDEPARENSNYELLDDYFEVMVTHDPLWVDMYNFLSTSVSFYQARPDLTVKLIERGLKTLSPAKNPQAWLVWRTKGIDELLLLGDIENSIKSHEMAAKWAENIPNQDLVPRLREFANLLRNNPNNQLIRIQSWILVYGATEDKLVRKRAIQELIKLGVKVETQTDGNLSFIIPPEAFKPLKPNEKTKL